MAVDANASVSKLQVKWIGGQVVVLQSARAGREVVTAELTTKQDDLEQRPPLFTPTCRGNFPANSH